MPSAEEEETPELFYASLSAGGNIELWALRVQRVKCQGKEKESEQLSERK